MKPITHHICAWCKRPITIIARRFPTPTPNISHGLCKRCLPTQLRRTHK